MIPITEDLSIAAGYSPFNESDFGSRGPFPRNPRDSKNLRKDAVRFDSFLEEKKREERAPTRYKEETSETLHFRSFLARNRN